MAPRGGGESKAGLVVSLVLFILLSIGLGVGTYYGYEEAALAKKAAKEEVDKAKAWEKGWDFARFQAMTYRAYMGYPIIDEKTGQPDKTALEDIGTYRSKWDDGKGPLVSDKDPSKNQNIKLIQDLDKRFGWDGAQKKPGKTYEDELKRLENELTAAKTALTQEQGRTADLQGQLARAVKARNDADVAFKAQLGTLQQQTEEEKAKIRTEITALQAKINEVSKTLNEKLKEATDGRLAEVKEKTKLQQELKFAAQKADGLQDKLDRTIVKPNEQPKGIVFRIDRTGTMPYINLGYGDNLKPQVPFSIVGKGSDGKPLRDSKGKLEVKGSLEVIRVVGEHLAQARITDLHDPGRDPVLPGDLLFNPAWSPNLKQHVAIAGRIDLTGSGRDDISEFMRTLEQQNVIVDAYLDMKTNTRKGEVTRQTDLLILGTVPEAHGIVRDGDKRFETELKAVAAITEMENLARKYGVQTIKLKEFLVQSGYPLPRSLGSDSPERAPSARDVSR
jgi:hypothetical protein